MRRTYADAGAAAQFVRASKRIFERHADQESADHGLVESVFHSKVERCEQRQLAGVRKIVAQSPAHHAVQRERGPVQRIDAAERCAHALIVVKEDPVIADDVQLVLTKVELRGVDAFPLCAAKGPNELGRDDGHRPPPLTYRRNEPGVRR